MPNYSYIIFNINNLTNVALFKLLKELEIQQLALFLKNKFQDGRSIIELSKLIKEEYNL